MFALRRQLLVPSSTGRVAEFRGPIAISVPTTSTSQGDDDGGRHQQVRRWYGRTCPAVRRHALRKKRAAATENAAASAKSGVATMGKNATTSSGGGSSSSTATFATSSSVLLDEAKNTNNDRPGTLAAKAASIVNLNNLKISQGGPTMEIAQSMPIDYAHMDNISLLTLSAMRNEKARGEMLRRHIMVVDNVSYKEACITFKKIEAENRKGMKVHTIPYKMGIMAAGGAAFCSIPLCFHLPTVEWFNEFYVTTDVPPPEDLETWLEVGSWAWNWMEPPLGQISFFLLCLQFARSQISNLGVRPYTAKLKALRAEKIVRKFPQYDATLLADYSKSVNFY